MPRLVIREGPGMGRDHSLGVGTCVLGRDPGADFVLDDELASRRHAQVVGRGGGWILEDLGSTNGTQVNGRRTKRAVLADGDTIRIGTTVLRFVQKGLLG